MKLVWRSNMITDSFDNKTKCLVSLKDFYGEQKFIVDKCLIIFSRKIYERVLHAYSCEKIGEIRAANGRFPIYMFEHEGQKLAFYLTAIGSTLASLYCMECNWITGAHQFIMFGSAGSLDKDKTEGKFVIPTEAYRDEGMSYHYAPASDYIKIKNHAKVAQIFQELNVPFVEGRIWTTDAFLRETVGQIERRQKEGCIAVEMEVAGVQAVCDFHNLELYDFLVTGDVLSTTSYDASGLHAVTHAIDKFHLALEIAKRI